MGVGAGLYMYDVVLKTFTFAISSTDEFLFYIYFLYNGIRPEELFELGHNIAVIFHESYIAVYLGYVQQ